MYNVTDISRMSDRMIVIRVLVQGMNVLVISIYNPWYSFHDSQKDNL